jgi:hypothetical protein
VKDKLLRNVRSISSCNPERRFKAARLIPLVCAFASLNETEFIVENRAGFQIGTRHT